MKRALLSAVILCDVSALAGCTTSRVGGAVVRTYFDDRAEEIKSGFRLEGSNKSELEPESCLNEVFAKEMFARFTFKMSQSPAKLFESLVPALKKRRIESLISESKIEKRECHRLLVSNKTFRGVFQFGVDEGKPIVRGNMSPVGKSETHHKVVLAQCAQAVRSALSVDPVASAIMNRHGEMYHDSMFDFDFGIATQLKCEQIAKGNLSSTEVYLHEATHELTRRGDKEVCHYSPFLREYLCFEKDGDLPPSRLARGRAAPLPPQLMFRFEGVKNLYAAESGDVVQFMNELNAYSVSLHTLVTLMKLAKTSNELGRYLASDLHVSSMGLLSVNYLNVLRDRHPDKFRTFVSSKKNQESLLKLFNQAETVRMQWASFLRSRKAESVVKDGSPVWEAYLNGKSEFLRNMERVRVHEHANSATW